MELCYFLAMASPSPVGFWTVRSRTCGLLRSTRIPTPPRLPLTAISPPSLTRTRMWTPVLLLIPASRSCSCWCAWQWATRFCSAMWRTRASTSGTSSRAVTRSTPSRAARSAPATPISAHRPNSCSVLPRSCLFLLCVSSTYLILYTTTPVHQAPDLLCAASYGKRIVAYTLPATPRTELATPRPLAWECDVSHPVLALAAAPLRAPASPAHLVLALSLHGAHFLEDVARTQKRETLLRQIASLIDS